MGSSCSRVITVYLPSLSYIKMGVLGCSNKIESVKKEISPILSDERPGFPMKSRTKKRKIPYIAKLADELPAHAARASGRRDISGDRDGAEIAGFGSLSKIPLSVGCLSMEG